MGTIKIVTNADYSANAVGRVDFNTGVFRRKVNGKLERNVPWLNLGTVDGYGSVDLSQDVIKVKTSFVYGNHSGAQRIFSAADYNTQRAFMLSHLKTNDAKLQIQLWFMSEQTAYAMIVNIGAAPTVSTNYDVEYVIDYKNKKFISVVVNGVVCALGSVTTVTNATAWTNGQTRSICFGQVANYQNDTAQASRAFPFFGQVSDMENNVLLHIDFLGDNTTEILTEKAKGYILTKTSEVIINSMPLDLD